MPSIKKLEQEYENKKCWGMVASIDVYGCDSKFIKDRRKIQTFINQLCREIEMVKYGPSHIARFAEGDLEGTSAMQFIETSSITIHFDEMKNRAFIDIFSCKFFDYLMAKRFCQQFLKGKRAKATYYFRA